jgi:hypothetical protein
MALNDDMALGDRDMIPTDEYLETILGGKMVLWQSLLSHATGNYNDISGTWNYYNDGKQWLYKLTRKKKTIFWGAIFKDTFRITFYFGNKAEPVLEKSDLPSSIKEGFKTAQRYGLIKPVSMKVHNDADIEIVKKLIAIKISLK